MVTTIDFHQNRGRLLPRAFGPSQHPTRNSTVHTLSRDAREKHLAEHASPAAETWATRYRPPLYGRTIPQPTPGNRTRLVPLNGATPRDEIQQRLRALVNGARWPQNNFFPNFPAEGGPSPETLRVSSLSRWRN